MVKILATQLILFLNIINLLAQFEPRTLEIWKGSTPTIDGVISENEYSDAVSFKFDSAWYDTPTTTVKDRPLEFSLKAYSKHDGTDLFFAFDVTDSTIYGYDTPRWIPDGTSNINDLTLANDWPFWGDAIEIFLYTTNRFSSTLDQGNVIPTQSSDGKGYAWNSVCNTHKSSQGQLEYGGLVEGYPRDISSWNIYNSWIENGYLEAKVRIKSFPELRGYVIEWKINSKPCLQVGPVEYWAPSVHPDTMRINIEAEDIDRREEGTQWANMRHIYVYSERKDGRDKNKIANWALLVIHPETLPGYVPVGLSMSRSENNMKLHCDPNPIESNSKICFYMAAPSLVQLQVVGIDGRIVNTLINSKVQEGYSEIYWNGTDSNHHNANKGIYVISLTSEYDRSICKVIIK